MEEPALSGIKLLVAYSSLNVGDLTAVISCIVLVTLNLSFN